MFRLILMVVAVLGLSACSAEVSGKNDSKDATISRLSSENGALKVKLSTYESECGPLR